jgi:hypothetical protein
MSDEKPKEESSNLRLWQSVIGLAIVLLLVVFFLRGT